MAQLVRLFEAALVDMDLASLARFAMVERKIGLVDQFLGGGMSVSLSEAAGSTNVDLVAGNL